MRQERLHEEVTPLASPVDAGRKGNLYSGYNRSKVRRTEYESTEIAKALQSIGAGLQFIGSGSGGIESLGVGGGQGGFESNVASNNEYMQNASLYTGGTIV